MGETQDTETSLMSNVCNITLSDSVTDKSIVQNDSKPSSSKHANVYEHLFDQLKENNKHIFVLSTAGKPIYTR